MANSQSAVPDAMDLDQRAPIEIAHQLAQGLSDAAALEKETWLKTAYEKQKDSVFFGKFSPEVRDKIYGYLLITTEPIEYYTTVDVGIMSTCRACTSETYPILYGRNIYTFNQAHYVDDRVFVKLGGKSPLV